MKKTFVSILLTLTMIIFAQAETKAIQIIRSGTREILARDTLIGSDSIKIPLHLYPEFQRGYYNFMYGAQNVHTNDSLKVVLYWEESLDPTNHGYFNRTLIDTIRQTPDSVLCIDSTLIHGTEYGEFVVDAFGDAADTIDFWIIFQALPK